MSRVLPAVIRSRHGAYLDRWYREHEQHHHDGVNRLVVRFAREGVEVVAVFVTNLNLTTYCYEPTAIACSWPNTKDQTSHLPIRRCNTRNPDGNPLLGRGIWSVRPIRAGRGSKFARAMRWRS